MGSACTLLWCLLCALLACTAAIPRDYLYEIWDASLLAKGDDLAEEVRLVVPIIFYGTSFSTIYVNSNGILSFQTELAQFFNSEFPLDYPIIAPLYSNVDTTSSGRISYTETDDPRILEAAAEKIRGSFSDAADFYPTSVFLVTWENVGYHLNGSDKGNTFQVAVISDNEDSYVEFLYPENGIQWIQGTGDGSGLPDARAQAGLIAPDGRYYLLPGSGTDRAYSLTRWSNMNVPGNWLFRVGIVFDENNVEIPDVGAENQEYNIPKTCSESSTQCHSHAKCVDYDNGFCCKCNENYYGNGNFCVKNDVPIRVNGRLSGEVNGVSFSNLDLQCYVVMKDARTYTAVSKIPIELGFSVQSLQILGSTIGWIFAKPLGDALNGFQITGGVFNHTVEFNSPSTGHSLTIRQTYLGLDVFDRLRLDVVLEGTLPALPHNSNATISEYHEEYSVTGPGVIQSLSTRLVKYNDSYSNNVELPFKIKQNIIYDYCNHTTPPIGTSWKLKVGKNFISYEGREQIIRFGLSNKIGPLEDIDPCEEGRSTCIPNSSCVIEGDSFRCICNPGFQEIETYNQIQCADINECQSGQHDCNLNAACINEIGTYRCECRSDYVGDGRVCEPATSCSTVACPENAHCVESGIARCVCLPGFAPIGQTCVAMTGHNCYYNNNCSPFGYCGLSERGQYQCFCLPGYKGDGYTCDNDAELVQTTTPIAETSPASSAPTNEPEVVEPPNATEEQEPITERNRDVVEETCMFGKCWCPYGYEKIQETTYCKKIAVTDSTTIPAQTADEESESCNTLNNCDINAECLFSASGVYNCLCKPGYRGDGYKCETVEQSCMDNNICDIRANCQYDDYGKAVCICGPGYQGDGLTCLPIATCTKDEDCLVNEECSYDHNTQTYECLCKEGMIRDSQHQCVALDENCGGGECVENAECLYDPDYQTHYCACKANFTGDGINECKPKPLGCDVLRNCGLNALCSYNISSNLYECECASGYLGDGFLCYKERDCHMDPSMCDIHARCLTNSQRKYICDCDPGYHGNGTTCNEIPKYGGNFLLLNQGMATLKIPFEITKKNRPRPIQVQIQQVAVGLDADCLEGRFYWSDIFSRAIRSATLNGTDKKDFINYGVGSPEGISIDWISRNIYWTDSTNKTIEVANIEKKLTRTLINANLVNPRGIAVHPERGKIFWSDWDRKNPKIEWANADGSDRRVFLNGSVVGLPNSLTIDFDTENLCYADAGTKLIQCVDIDTKVIRVIATNCSYPFGIATTKDKIYWSDWLTKKIEQVDKVTLTRLKPLIIPVGGGSNKLYEVVAVPDRCPRLVSVCQYHREQCPVNHICIPDGKGSRRCLCGKSIHSPSEETTCNDL